MSSAASNSVDPPYRPRLAARLCGVLLAWILAGQLTGCSSPKYAKLRSVPKSPLVEQLKLTSRGGPQPSPRTMQVLRQFNLHTQLRGDWKDLLRDFQTVLEQQATPEKVYAFSEINYLAAKKVEVKDARAALDYYGASVAHAYLYLFDERFAPVRNPYDPEFRGACDLYNGALEGALRIVKKQGALSPGCTHTIETATQAWDVTVVARDGQWKADDFERFEFVSDFEVQGLTNQYQNFGLGVPLIAVRKRRDDSPRERYYPAELSFPVTAFLRLMPDSPPGLSGPANRHTALLELHDPLSSVDVHVGSRLSPLETDLSTPLAYFLNNPQLNELATDGLLRPDKAAAIAGLYMLQPYEPGKIPVIMVHGLWSSPLTWMEMFNDLRSVPEIRASYQFWFYLYPTGEPFWNSATKMRADLAELRAVLDPQRQEPTLDRMVLVGHSMGGLISRMQTVYSDNRFWEIVSDKPFEVVKSDEETLRRLHDGFFFEANPSISRLITIGTPHRGSKFANQATRFISHSLISLPKMPGAPQQQLFRDNPDVFRDDSIVEIKTSLDSLAPDSPILPVLLEARKGPWVKYHNIIGVLPNKGFIGAVAGGTDGVVSFESAHLDDAASEIRVIDADHSTVHRHPYSVLEVRRILIEHLVELAAVANGPAPGPVQAASQPGPAVR